MTIIRNTLWGKEEIKDTQVCIDCKEELPLNEFSINKTMYDRNNPNGRILRRRSCKSCRKNNRVPISASERKRYPKPREDYFTCLACGVKKETTLARLDHDHITGKVNGWICNACNVGFGNFGESLEIAIKALEWKYKVKINYDDQKES